MTKKFTQREKAKILWDAGHTTTKSLQRRGKIPERSARRYVREFEDGGSGERKAYKPRRNTKKTPKLVEKVLRKAKDRNKIWSSREIGTSVGASSSLVLHVLHESGVKYTTYKKKVKLTKERKDKRLSFAQEMLTKESDWGFTFFSDECSFWLSKCQPNKLWTDNPLLEEGTGIHGPKVHCWGGQSLPEGHFLL